MFARQNSRVILAHLLRWQGFGICQYAGTLAASCLRRSRFSAAGRYICTKLTRCNIQESTDLCCSIIFLKAEIKKEGRD